MPDQSDVSDALLTNATGPKKVSVDGQSVEQHSIQDQIELDRYLSSKRAANARPLGVKRFRFVHPGAGD